MQFSEECPMELAEAPCPLHGGPQPDLGPDTAGSYSGGDTLTPGRSDVLVGKCSHCHAGMRKNADGPLQVRLPAPHRAKTG